MNSPAPRSPSMVTLEVDGGVATITLNRPDALNSINPATMHQLQTAFAQAAGDDAVRGIVIAGAGKAFMVGADIGFFLRNIESGDIARIVKFTETGHTLLDAIDRSAKPVVARVHGAAIGAGTEIALACDYVLASPAASFALPETALGIYPGLGGTQRGPRRLGVGLAKWMIFTGKTVSAADAWQIGLVDDVVPPERLDEAARALAMGSYTCQIRPQKSAEIIALEAFFAASRVTELQAGTAHAAGNPTLQRAMKLVAAKPARALGLAEQLIDQGLGGTLEDGLRLEIAHLVEVFTSPEAARGLRSRAPRRS